MYLSRVKQMSYRWNKYSIRFVSLNKYYSIIFFLLEQIYVHSFTVVIFCVYINVHNDVTDYHLLYINIHIKCNFCIYELLLHMFRKQKYYHVFKVSNTFYVYKVDVYKIIIIDMHSPV